MSDPIDAVESKAGGSLDRSDLLLLGILAAVTCYVHLAWLWVGQVPGNDSAIYTEVARRMVRSGDLLGSDWFGYRVVHNYPLFLWLLAGFGWLLGFSTWAMRLLPALCGVGATLMLVPLARAMGLETRVGVWAGLLLLGSTANFVIHRGVLADPLVVLLSILAFYSYLRGEEKPGWYVVGGAALSAVFITKVSIGIFPSTAIVLHLLCFRRWPVLRSGCFWVAFGMAMATLLGWYGYIYLAEGPGVLGRHLGVTLVDRLSGGMAELRHSSRGPLFYLEALVKQGPFGWVSVGLALGGLGLALHNRRREAGLAVVWTLLYLGVLLLTPTRLYHYILWVLPPIALLGALLLDRLALGRRPVGHAFTALLVLVALWSPVGALATLKADEPLARMGRALRAAYRPGMNVFAVHVYAPGLVFHSGGLRVRYVAVQRRAHRLVKVAFPRIKPGMILLVHPRRLASALRSTGPFICVVHRAVWKRYRPLLRGFRVILRGRAGVLIGSRLEVRGGRGGKGGKG